MSFFYNLKYRFGTFSIAEKIILINVVFFVLPMLLKCAFLFVQYSNYCLFGLATAFSQSFDFYYKTLVTDHI